jgi:hypothetical protein
LLENIFAGSGNSQKKDSSSLLLAMVSGYLTKVNF